MLYFGIIDFLQVQSTDSPGVNLAVKQVLPYISIYFSIIDCVPVTLVNDPGISQLGRGSCSASVSSTFLRCGCLMIPA